MKNTDIGIPHLMTREQFLDMEDAVIKLLKRRLKGFLIEPLWAAEFEKDVSQYLEFKTDTGTSKQRKARSRT